MIAVAKITAKGQTTIDLRRPGGELLLNLLIRRRSTHDANTARAHPRFATVTRSASSA